ncbi:MAG: altronate dehydratase [Clostridia bacterium]|nr:altronate dehydratase [Clostridia bacterium]
MIINPLDNVEVNLGNGHKYAICDIKRGSNVIKYGNPIGHAVCDIKKGEHIHTHNLKTNLSGNLEYTYKPDFLPVKHQNTDKTFMGYVRKDGKVGIRNEIWIIPTVGCVNDTAKILAQKTDAVCFEHPFGCSQLGSDAELTKTVLKGLVNHPNAAGVLVLGLGCENNNIKLFKEFLGEYDKQRVKFLNTQDVNDEILEGVKIINELKEFANSFKPQKLPISKLVIGLKCGGSDGYSGITANSLVGSLSDKLVSFGGSCVLSEVPEMFGAEHLLMRRCENEKVFLKTVNLINCFKNYFTRHNQVIYENPSPGNKEGGITTLEEKSLGCVQKAGNTPVVDVLDYGDTVKKSGVSLLNGPGNDIVAVTNLTCAGAHLILFTTGRGTPVGAPVPTVKISTNNTLYKNKPHWIDFNAGALLDGKSMDVLTDELLEKIIDIASGEQTKNEQNGYRQISIFKDGVVL